MNFTKKITLLILLAAITFNSIAQKKNVAVVTFYSNKIVGVSQLAGGVAVVTAAAKLSKDPNFNLKPILDKFHEEFFSSYAKKFPFNIVDESAIIENEKYKNLIA